MKRGFLLGKPKPNPKEESEPKAESDPLMILEGDDETTVAWCREQLRLQDMKSDMLMKCDLEPMHKDKKNRKKDKKDKKKTTNTKDKNSVIVMHRL